MSDETPDANAVPTKPLPVPADSGAPTEPLSADLVPDAGVPAAPLVAVSRTPGWVAPVVIILTAALLLVLAVAVIPSLLADRSTPVPSITPTLPSSTPTVTEEEAPQQQQPTEQPPVIVVPEPTEIVPAPTETAAEPDPTPTP